MRACGLLHEEPVRLLANGERLWEGKIGPRSKNIVLRVRKRAGMTSRWRLRSRGRSWGKGRVVRAKAVVSDAPERACGNDEGRMTKDKSNSNVSNSNDEKRLCETVCSFGRYSDIDLLFVIRHSSLRRSSCGSIGRRC